MSSAYARVLLRVERKIIVPDLGECWLWLGAISSNGYGAINVKVDGRWTTMTTHKVVYEHHKGPVPRGKMILHACDQQPCCAPHHLELGDGYQNMRDMMERKRGRNQFTSLADLGIEPLPPVETEDEIPF